MKITHNSVVSIEFKLTDAQGALLDASAGGTPLVYLHGAAGVVPGLEKELEGKVAGECFSVTLKPAEGFGETNSDLIQTIATSSLPDPDQIKPGMRIEGTGQESGQVISFVVREINDEHVTLDSNHPLAGLTLCFEGVVHDVREATDEEISQGHPL